jgi:hypothetical protein
LGRIEEEDEDQLARQERQEERQQEERQERPDEEGEEAERRRRVKLGRPRTPEPIGLGMTHEDDEEPRRRSSPRPYSVIDQLFERFAMLSSLLEPAIELSSTLQAQYAAAQNTVSALESKATHSRNWYRLNLQCHPHHHLNPPQLPNNPTQSRKSLTDGRNPSKANDLPSVRNGPQNTNDLRPPAKNGKKKSKSSR